MIAGMIERRRSSGLERIPPVFSRPVWRDAFFWLLIAMAGFWTLVIWYFFV